MNTDWSNRLQKNASELILEAELLFENKKYRRATFLQITAYEQLVKAIRLKYQTSVNPKSSHSENLNDLQLMLDDILKKTFEVLKSENLQQTLIDALKAESINLADPRVDSTIKTLTDNINNFLTNNLAHIKFSKLRSEFLYEDKIQNKLPTDNITQMLYKLFSNTNNSFLELLLSKNHSQ